ncbi:ACP S-malonyltransferase [Anaeromyxobacter dehalogenans]|uniref:Malonyl CoA-acyl carrier protein transacylase n=1 Tax=Anaeromyxobacter dehalogenans (strain 2CP-C) TaxID=290397 RepID=Q2ILI5_ANADE|nr:ACP S-malonyltransferase [Anaeromyxobacter dehalogenans]ABC82519.1 [Acyl-carrier-protein] S-malonyltransferase [Anaeromyxobacter dehalogenans 2CP-C]
MGKLAFVFPGQGSQAVGMGKDLHDAFPEAREIFEEVDEALGEKLSALCFGGPEDQLKLTANTQPSILTVSSAAAAVLANQGLVPDFVAGHSLGEYSALVAVGACGAAEAARAVRARGTFMQEAVPAGQGAMSAVLGLDPARVREICAAVASETGQVVSPANYNEPAQTVIAGAAGAVEQAGARLKEAGAKRVLPLPVSAPFHSALMAPVKARLEPVLRGIAWKAPLRPVVTNVEAKPNQDAARVVPLLVEQVTAPVRWIECVEELVRLGVTRVVEVGPGKVLSGLIRRIDRSVEAFNVEDRASLEKTLAALKG